MTRLMLGTVIALLFFIAIMLGCGGEADESSDIKPERISVEELRDLLDSQADVVLLDVRGKDYYEAGHIPSAISMPFPDGIQTGHQELPQDKMVILY